MKITIFGNSVAMRMRPPRSGPQDGTYAEWLSRQGNDVRTVASAGALLSEAFATLDVDVVSTFPDYVIINYGVVEICYRRTARWINNKTLVNYYLNDVFARPFVFSTPATRASLLFWRLLNGLVRRAAGVLGLKWQWMSPARFIQVLDAVIQVLLKETATRIIVMGIIPCSTRVERILAGSAEVIGETNRTMKELVARHGARVTFLAPEDILAHSRVCLDELAPDGVHFSAEGHRAVAAAICSQLVPAHD